MTLLKLGKWGRQEVMTLNQLNYYVEIVRQGSFTKAAEKLFVSQSTLSKAIRALEEEFQMELINRGTKEFQLTAQGDVFYEYAVRILDFYHTQTQELFQRLHSANGTLKLGIPPTAGAIYFFSILYKFRETYPGIDLKIEEITSKAVHELVAAGKLDMGIVIEPFSDDKFYKRPSYTSEAVLLVSRKHPLAAKRSVSFAALREEKFLLVTPDYMFHDVVLEKCREAGFVPDVTFESYQWELLFEMVADNQGICILPKPLVDKFNNTRVHQVHLKDPEFPWTLSLIYRKDKFITVPMQCFLDLCFGT